MIQLFYNENIKDLMKWDDSRYLIFLSCFNQAYEYYKASLNKSKIYSDNYVEYLLSLFFVVNQLNATVNSPKISNPRAIFLASLCFYLVEEGNLQAQTDDSLHGLTIFLENLLESEILVQADITHTLRILRCFKDSALAVLDDGSFSDYLLTKDLLMSTDPIIHSKNNKIGIMYFHSNYSEIKFRIGSNPPTAQDFFEVMYKQYSLINSTFLKYSYKDRLSTIMDLHSSGKLLFQF